MSDDKLTEKQFQEFLDIAFQYKPNNKKFLYAPEGFLKKMERWLDPTKAAVEDLLDEDTD